MREQIKQVATELLIRNGYRGLRFNDIAERLEITRANVHYHFGTKIDLAEEVIAEYMERVLKRFEHIWTAPNLNYQNKVLHTIEFNRESFMRFNPSGSGRNSWSLIDRMRQESELLSEPSRIQLRRIEKVEAFVISAIRQAQSSGEISEDVPLEDISVSISTIIDCACALTQSWGSFERLENCYLAHMRLVLHAYGVGDAVQALPQLETPTSPAIRKRRPAKAV